MKSHLVATLAVLSSALSFLSGQEVTAGIFGVVQDSSSAVIPGAQIALKNVATGREHRTTSDESGNFSLPFIPIGTYTITAEAQGFKKSTVNEVILRVNENRRVSFTMEVGQLSEQISVEAAAVSVNLATGTTSQLLDGKDMVNLPARGRNVLPFALLMPGVVSTTPYDRRNNNSAVNGVRPTHNAWLLDGGYNIDTGGNWGTPLAPNIESVAEFRAIRGNYSAEFGVGGGSQFNVITKGGTNNLHGSAYYFHRNDKLNARNFFVPTRPAFRGNDFGFTVGGPVFLPKIYNGKNKTFFFVLLGYIKERRYESFFQNVPTAAYKNGDFSALGRPIYDPNTGQPFPGNVIPSSRIDANARGYAKMYPDPNFINSAGQNFFTLQRRLDNTDEKNFRVDHNFTDSHRVMWRYTPEFRLSNYRVSPGFSFLQRQDETPARNMTVNYNASFRPNLIMDFNWVRSHNRIKQFPPDLSGATWGINIPQLFADTDQTYPLTSLNLSKVPDRVPTINSMTGYAAINPSSPWSNYQTIYEFRDTFTWIKNAHTIKTGFNYSYEIKFEPTNTDVFGRFSFDGRYTRAPGASSGGDGFADLLLGKPNSYDETNTVAFNDNRRASIEAFVDDSWKATRRLTLNFGVRYSYFPAAHEPDDRFRVFIPSLYDPAKAVTVNDAGQIIRGTGDRFNGLVNPKNYWQNHKKNFAPRFSFAYDLFGNGRTAVRGGYGLFYSREILGAFILMSGNPPFSELVTIENTSLSSPGGGSARNYDLPIALGSIDMNQLTPYTQQWNFNIQHGLTNNMVLELGYSGSRGIHFMRTQDINQPLPSARVASGGNANQVRPYKGWSTISHREQSYASNYHGLQVGLNRNFSRGLMFQTAYTWSKAIDNADFTGGIYGVVPNSMNSTGERARASFDATHNFIGSLVYDIPFLKERKDILGKAFGGWQVSSIYTVRTGLPISPELGRDNAGVGYNTRQRPLAGGSPELPRSMRTVDQWFNASVYSAPALGTFSPVNRNIISGPGWNQWDMTFMKYFRIKEGVRFELRAEGYNFFNHTQFSTVGTTFTTAATFGKVTAARDPRSFMVGGRLQF
ncbi:MAG: carboxypeptidase regulatory-like domain-containing protein [Bryobacterales bacterium]|nr:carboxypeptidase regulatory-like domain-containing protein [Bryobacterales bacterium]